MYTKRLEQLEKKRLGETDASAEEAALQRHLRQIDRRILAGIERRYGHHIPAARIERARQEPIRFQESAEFNARLEACGLRSGEGTRILGYVDRRIWIDREHKELSKTVAHERLHELSDPLHRAMLGDRINEGTAEFLAKEVAGDLHLVNEGKCYQRETRLVEMIAASVGEQTIAESFFRGDWNKLQSAVDAHLGRGAMADISGLAQQGRFDDAEQIVKNGRSSLMKGLDPELRLEC